MVRIRALTALFVAVAPLCVHAERKVTVKLKQNKIKEFSTLSLQSADPKKPLFTFPGGSVVAPALEEFRDRFFDAEGNVFIFDTYATKYATVITDTPKATQAGAIVSPAPITTNSQEDEAPSMSVTDKAVNQQDMPIAKIQEKSTVTTLPSYRVMLERLKLTPLEAQAFLKRQAYVTQTQNYMLQILWKDNPLAQVKGLLRIALENLSKFVIDNFVVDNNKPLYFTVDIENEKSLASHAIARPLYNTVREFGQVFGFDMPSIEKAWYVRHKGKIALGAGVLALLTYAHYSNAFGTRGIASAKPAAAGQAPQVVAQPSLLERAKTAVSAKLYQAAKQVGGEANKEVTKAIVRRLEYKQGLRPELGSDTFVQKAADVGGLEFVKEAASAYGHKLVPETVSAPVATTPMAPTSSWSPATWGSSAKTWFSDQWDKARGASFKKVLGPAGVGKSFADWK